MDASGPNGRKSKNAQCGYVRRQFPRACLQGVDRLVSGDAFARVYADLVRRLRRLYAYRRGRGNIRCAPKNVFVIPPFVEHGLKDERDNFTIICCEFPAELITGDNLFDPAGAACCAIPASKASRRFSAARVPAIRRGAVAG